MGLVQEESPGEPEHQSEEIFHSMSIEEQIERNRLKNNPDKVKADEERRMENDIKAVSNTCNIYKVVIVYLITG